MGALPTKHPIDAIAVPQDMEILRSDGFGAGRLGPEDERDPSRRRARRRRPAGPRRRAPRSRHADCHGPSLVERWRSRDGSQRPDLNAERVVPVAGGAGHEKRPHEERTAMAPAARRARVFMIPDPRAWDGSPSETVETLPPEGRDRVLRDRNPQRSSSAGTDVVQSRIAGGDRAGGQGPVRGTLLWTVPAQPQPLQEKDRQ